MKGGTEIKWCDASTAWGWRQTCPCGTRGLEGKAEWCRGSATRQGSCYWLGNVSRKQASSWLLQHGMWPGLQSYFASPATAPEQPESDSSPPASRVNRCCPQNWCSESTRSDHWLPAAGLTCRGGGGLLGSADLVSGQHVLGSDRGRPHRNANLWRPVAPAGQCALGSIPGTGHRPALINKNMHVRSKPRLHPQCRAKLSEGQPVRLRLQRTERQLAT